MTPAERNIKAALIALIAGKPEQAENLLGYAVAAIRAERAEPLVDLANDLASASGTARHAKQPRLAKHLLRLAGHYREGGGRYATATAFGDRTGD